MGKNTRTLANVDMSLIQTLKNRQANLVRWLLVRFLVRVLRYARSLGRLCGTLEDF